jgi:hypothetical protein
MKTIKLVEASLGITICGGGTTTQRAINDLADRLRLIAGELEEVASNPSEVRLKASNSSEWDLDEELPDDTRVTVTKVSLDDNVSTETEFDVCEFVHSMMDAR